MMTYALWSVQGLLALLFLFAGGMKLVLPLEALTAQMPLPGGDVASALMPLAVGLLATFVAYGRWRLAPHRESSHPSTLRPAS